MSTTAAADATDLCEWLPARPDFLRRVVDDTRLALVEAS